MINRETIDRINDASRIEEVVGDFVQLKKRGVNLLGLCPFHNEKSPSFNVNPTRNIYKCFGCGKGGDPVNFVMEHEKYSYPEALRYLAQKYNIEIEEIISDKEDNAEADRKESLYVVSDFAKKYFAETLHQHDEGKTIGLSYFKERGFREETIEKFELGYSLNEWSGLTDAAIKLGYKEEFLESSGLSIRNEQKNSLYDRFRGRVMFPIHNLTGRVIAFGGRILKTDPKSPKYVNSPESDIYHKSNVLYGIYFAKRAIREFDNCYLVEGYTDVISLHQSGIENVVSSSGTSLTVEQIRQIGRFTQNVTILFDGDAAGIKASLRGLDMILEEGLNVKIALFPDGHDPDSYVKSAGGAAFKDFITQNQKDFILFKTTLLLDEAQNDPIKKAGLIHDIVESIAKIPDSIKASVYVSECSQLLKMEERILLSELNKLRLKKIKKTAPDEAAVDSLITNVSENEPQPEATEDNDDRQEKEIIRLLFNYGELVIEENQNIAQFIIQEMEEVTFDNEQFSLIVKEYKNLMDKGSIPTEQQFIHHSDEKISQLAVSLLSTEYHLSENWEQKHDIRVPKESEVLRNAVYSAIYHLKMRKVMRMIIDNQQKLKLDLNDDDMRKHLNIHMHLTNLKKNISEALGAVILK